jgi:hypothetical protein
MIISFGIPKNDMTSTKTTLPEGFLDLSEKIVPHPLIEAAEKTADKQEAQENIHYPSLYFSNAPEGMSKLKKEGTAVIHYRKVMEREEKVERDGKTISNYCVELEIHGIKPSGEDATYETKVIDPDDEDAIEEGLKEASQEVSTDKESEEESEEEIED